MGRLLILLILAFASQGCTTLSLQRNFLEHTATSTDSRYREVMENLAILADDPAVLPAYSSIFAGTTEITDTLPVTSMTTWSRALLKPIGSVTTFGTEVLDFPFTRNVAENWTLDPTIVPEKLVAMRCACWYVLYGPGNNCGDCTILGKYDPASDSPGYYFRVDEQLRSLPIGWLKIGRHCDVPCCAVYSAECHGVCVWVNAGDVKYLSAFTLVLQQIARADLNTVWSPPTVKRTITLNGNETHPAAESRPPSGVKSVSVTVDQNGFLLMGDGSSGWPRKTRLDNLGQNALLRSVVSAAAKSP